MSPKKWLDLTAAVNLLALCGLMALSMLAFSGSWNSMDNVNVIDLDAIAGNDVVENAVGKSVEFPFTLAFAFVLGSSLVIYNLLFVFVLGKNRWEKVSVLIFLCPLLASCTLIALFFLDTSNEAIPVLQWLLFLAFGIPVVPVLAIIWMLLVACFHKSRLAIVQSVSALAMMLGSWSWLYYVLCDLHRSGSIPDPIKYVAMVAVTLPAFLASLPYAVHAFWSDCATPQNDGKRFHLAVAVNLLAVGVLTALAIVSHQMIRPILPSTMQGGGSVCAFVLSGAMVAYGIFFLLKHAKCPWERIPLLALLYPFLFYLLALNIKVGKYDAIWDAGSVLCALVVATVVVLWMIALACVRKSRSAIWASIAALALVLGFFGLSHLLYAQLNSSSLHPSKYGLWRYLTFSRALPPLVTSLPFFVFAFWKRKE